MNCIAITRYLTIVALLHCASCSAPATESVSGGDPLAYSVRYQITAVPAEKSVEVSMFVRQGRGLLREVQFRRGAQISNIRVDGELIEALDDITWRPSASGGRLQWTVALSHKRNGDGYDAWLQEDWGIFRAEDVIPRSTTRVIKGAYSKTTMQFDLPQDWTAITPYAAENGVFNIDKPQRYFDQPSGWIAIGRLGVRRDIIAGTRVAIAGPLGHSLRRMDALAFLNWTLPELSRALGELPPRLTIISAGAPMWRGGLSGPQSLFLHADRPLISENSTSTLLHEVLHSTLRVSAAPGYDWLVEGVAEYYSLELLRRSGTISEARFQLAMQSQVKWSESAEKLCKDSSSGASTALAVTVFAALDREIRDRSAGTASLDDVVRAMRAGNNGISLADLQTIVENLSGAKSDVLRLDKLPGCRSIESNSEDTA